jgi:phosphatidylserine decarboxylase
MKRTSRFPYIHSLGYPFIAAFAVVTLLLGVIGPIAFFIGLILTGWCVTFFRDPPRTTPTRPGLVVSPADGRIVAIADVVPEAELGLGDEKRTRISIFLNVFNVHVNRVPVDGKIVHLKYRPGKFVNASLDKASVDNERMAIALEMTGDHPMAGQKIGVVQIAGLIARRIVCEAEIDEKYKAGERYGLIRFGSRTDVYLPVGAKPLVALGQHMLGGETVLADFRSDELPRQGEVR